MENIVAKYKTYGIIPNKIFADYEGLCQSVWGRLFRICESDSIVGSVAE